MTSAIVVREAKGIEIHHRRSDRYIDAKAMCRAFGKRWDNYRANEDTIAVASAIATQLGINLESQVNSSGVIESRRGPGGGVFVHPRLAIHLAMWLDAGFAAQVMAWMEELLTAGSVAIAPARHALRTYTERIIVANLTRDEIPEGYWTVFHESSDLLITAEQLYAALGLEMDKYDLLDGSIGIQWPKYRERQDWAGTRIRYTHHFPPGDARGDQLAWAYPNHEIFQFRLWLRTIYTRSLFVEYIRRRYGAREMLRAVPALRALGVRVSTPLCTTAAS